MRFAILLLAAVLTAGLLATASLATNALVMFDGWSLAQQRMASGGMTVLSILILLGGALARRRQANLDGDGV